MQTKLTVLLISGLVLTGCGWFGSNDPVPGTPAAAESNALIPQRSGSGLFDGPEEEDLSVPVMSVSELRVDPTSSGAIIQVTGIASRQGAFDAELRPVNSEENAENGILAYSFRVTYPEDPTAQGPERTRTVTEAISVSAKTLSGIKLIRVEGQENAREARRR